MKFFRILALLVAGLLGVWSLPVSAKDTWRSVQSRNFLVVGNASEKELQKMAVKLEQFRNVLGTILNQAKFVTPLPTTVVLFKDQASFHDYAPMFKGKIRENVGGYFVPTQDGNYIALFGAAEQDSRSSVVLHEYTHFVVNNNISRPPKWLNEGLAEFYSTFDTREDGRKALIGTAVEEHVLELREQTIMPLKELFQIDHKSPQYNEGSRVGLFYAQSWALVHYLMLGNNGKRQAQLQQFLGKLTSNQPVEQLFQEVFQTDFKGMENELRNYIHLHTFPYLTYSFNSGFDTLKETTTQPISEAEAKTFRGDLLLWQRRDTEAEAHFLDALKIDPNLPHAHLSLGRLRILQKRPAEARPYFETAVAKDPQNSIAHSYVAALLVLEGKAKEALAAYQKALELNPNMAHIQFRYGQLQNALGHQEEAIEAYKKSLSQAPLKLEPLRALSNLHIERAEGNLGAIYGVTFVQRKGWEDEHAPYLALNGHFGFRQAQRMVPAANIVNEALTKLKPEAWPVPVFKYLKKELTADELVKQAKDNDQLTEAHAYIGLDLSLQGQTDAAVQHLEWVRENGNKTFTEYGYALAELNRIRSKKQ